MNNKYLLTVILTTILICPAFATNITADNKGCTSDTLTTDSGSAVLEADWAANTVGVTFYNGDTQYSTGQCTYDGTLTLPADDPEKTGYTFNGWTVRRAASHSGQQNEPFNPQQTTFDLSTLDPSINGTDYGYILNNGNSRFKDTKFGLTQNGEWAAEFSYGTIKGVSQCRKIEYECDYSEETGEVECVDPDYMCYCQVTGFDAEKDGTYLSVIQSHWVDLPETLHEDEAFCASCGLDCGVDISDEIYESTSLRQALYGITQ